MRLAPGSTIGSYRIVAAIGAGGMGEVYRATDTRLGRDVAIKVLPDSVANDPERLSRFEREARALAALNHFNIAQVYGFEGAALVMELLEGETLRARLESGLLPARKAIEYGVQIAKGLAAAHERGIVHRDLKPENIFIVSDGHIKILDFGLARNTGTAVSGVTETVTAAAGTEPGTVLGTAGYMSPEQVRGFTVDARSDIFSLGAVIYEMVTGQRAFRGDTSADIMSAILNKQPEDLSTVTAGAGPALERIVQHCLEKNPAERFQSARDIAFALESLSGSSPALVGRVDQPRAMTKERAGWALMTAALIGFAAWLALSPRATPPIITQPVSRTLLLLPEGLVFDDVYPPGARLALSPDGSRVAYLGRRADSGRAQVYVQSLDAGALITVPDTAQSSGPSWSPDGRELLLTSQNQLSRSLVDGGTPIAIPTGPINTFPGTWPSPDIALGGGSSVLRVNLKSGKWDAVLQGKPEDRFGWPQMLDDDRMMVTQVSGVDTTVRIVGVDNNKSESKVILSGADIGYAVHANGAVIFSRDQNVFAQRLNLSTASLEGEAVKLAGPVVAVPQRGAAFSVSNNGVLVYQSATDRPMFQLTWFDRQGRVLSTVGQPDDYTNLELSNDGKRLLASVTDTSLNTRDILIIDIARGVRQRFTIDASNERSAVWSPDGKSIIYTSKGLDLYERAADSSGAERPLLVDGASKDPYDWSSDGQLLIFRKSGTTGNDLWLMRTDGKGAPQMFAGTRFSESIANFSPDSRRIVYVSNESGQDEVYVTNIDGTGKTQISAAGGSFPRWRADGREILYLAPDRMLMSVPVERGSTFSVGAPTAVFRMNTMVLPGPVYDISPDGQRLIVATPVPSRVPPALTVLTNWPQLLDRK